MKIPIRNCGTKPLTLFIEVLCDTYTIPVEGEAIVTLQDDQPHSIDLYDDQITIWNESAEAAIVEIIEWSPHCSQLNRSNP
ncbi:hypothetical protein U1872_19125 [Sphingomonas sp. RB3P16]|uniref:hypothetical protein n=1 Tax=Parasphingomonas frigoris TaxID=3096163 RepID=UPI002FC87A18